MFRFKTSLYSWLDVLCQSWKKLLSLSLQILLLPLYLSSFSLGLKLYRLDLPLPMSCVFHLCFILGLSDCQLFSENFSGDTFPGPRATLWCCGQPRGPRAATTVVITGKSFGFESQEQDSGPGCTALSLRRCRKSLPL